MNKTLLTTLILILSSSNIAKSDWVKLKDGTVIHGEITVKSSISVNIKTVRNGKWDTLKFKANDVEEVEYETSDCKICQNLLNELNQEPITTESTQKRPSNEEVSSTWVLARGWGKDKETALKDAWRNAIESVAGTLITAESTIKNETLFKDIITAHSNGFIPEYEEISVEIDSESGIVDVYINALVQQKVLFKRIIDTKAFVYRRDVDGSNYYAAVVTQMDRDTSAIKTLSQAMKGYPEDIFDIKIGKDRQMVEGAVDDELERVIIPISFSFNTEGWNNFVNNLKAYLENVKNDSDSFNLRVAKHKGCRPTWHVPWDRKMALDEGFHSKWIFSGFGDYYHAMDVRKGGWWQEQFDRLDDIVVIVDKGLRKAIAYSMNPTVWESVRNRFRQTPAFDLRALDQNGSDIGSVNKNLFNYTMMQSTSQTISNSIKILPLPFTNHKAHELNGLTSNWKIQNFFFKNDNTNVHPRVLYVMPYFYTIEGYVDTSYTGMNHGNSCRYSVFVENLNEYVDSGVSNQPVLHEQFTRDYLVKLTLEELANFKEVRTELYVIDLHNRSIREYGEESQ